MGEAEKVCDVSLAVVWLQTRRRGFSSRAAERAARGLVESRKVKKLLSVVAKELVTKLKRVLEEELYSFLPSPAVQTCPSMESMVMREDACWWPVTRMLTFRFRTPTAEPAPWPIFVEPSFTVSLNK